MYDKTRQMSRKKTLQKNILRNTKTAIADLPYCKRAVKKQQTQKQNSAMRSTSFYPVYMAMLENVYAWTPQEPLRKILG